MQEDQATQDTQNWMDNATITLDVRPTLAEGGEPFVEIMEAAASIEPGQSLVIVAPFEPAPLYAALSARGFSHETQRIADDHWVVRFAQAS
jgi:uncharacterized protein (DUF2249 family)